MSRRNGPLVETFGCRLNIWESEVIRDHASAAGLSDAIIFNTCAVTAGNEKQARQAIRKARRNNPDAPIIVTGYLPPKLRLKVGVRCLKFHRWLVIMTSYNPKAGRRLQR